MENKIVFETKRSVDTKEYLSVLRELTEEGKNVSLTISGNSMSPYLIHERDQVFFEKPKVPLKRGDIVFFQREDGQYIMHRICKAKREGYYIVGDAQTEIEGPISEEQIFGVVTKVRRKGKLEQSGDFWWDFFEKIWICVIPIRPWIRGWYTLFRKKCKNKNRSNDFHHFAVKKKQRNGD